MSNEDFSKLFIVLAKLFKSFNKTIKICCILSKIYSTTKILSKEYVKNM